jgi:hypothetical protein
MEMLRTRNDAISPGRRLALSREDLSFRHEASSRDKSIMWRLGPQAGDDYEANTAWNFLVIKTMNLYFMNKYNLNSFLAYFRFYIQ